MNTKECMRAQMVRARKFSERLLADFHTPKEWTHQVHDNANHALWFAGHMGVSDNFFISHVDAARMVEKPMFNDKFGVGSAPSPNAADYPPVDEVLEFMRERRTALLETLDQIDKARLSESNPKGTPQFLPTIGEVYQTAVWHETLHSGQLTVARRALGHKPTMG